MSALSPVKGTSEACPLQLSPAGGEDCCSPVALIGGGTVMMVMATKGEGQAHLLFPVPKILVGPNSAGRKPNNNHERHLLSFTRRQALCYVGSSYYFNESYST